MSIHFGMLKVFAYVIFLSLALALPVEQNYRATNSPLGKPGNAEFDYVR